MASERHSPLRAGARLTARDLELLRFMAEHRLVLASQVEALLGISTSAAATRLRALAAAGFVSSRRIFHAQPAAHQITAQGLRAIGSQLPRPRIDLRCYRHDVDLAWLWLSAREDAFGCMGQVLGERHLRSHDAGRTPGAEPLGVRLGGLGPHGRERLHYPDLMLVTPEGQRIALELELSAKGQPRRERILAGYGADARIDAVLYLVKDPGVARSIQNSARRVGIASRVHVQWAHSATPDVGLASSRSAERSGSRRRGAEVAR